MEPQKKPNQKTKKVRRPYKVWRMLLFVWGIFLLALFGVAFFFWAVYQGKIWEMPDVQELENPDIFVSSEIFSADGKLLGRFESEKRIPIKYENLPDNLINALLAREDVRYMEHSGIDPRGTLRAVTSGGSSGGASTISQQLAKQLFTVNTSQDKIERMLQKLKEWVVAVELERRYTKEEIITMYLNKFDFIYNANGVELASKIYFNTTTDSLNLEQSAMLVAMLKNPNIYNPLRDTVTAKTERNVVINQMEKYGFIDHATSEATKALPIVTDRQTLSDTNEESYSAYYKSELKREVEAYLKKLEEETGKRYNIYKDGLKIYITLDSRMQKLAEDAVAKHLKSLQNSFFSEHKHNKRAPYYGVSDSRRQQLFETAMKRTNQYKRLESAGMSEEEILEEFNKPRDSIQIFTWDGIKYRKDASLMDSIIYHKHILQTGMMSMNPKDGTIKAWVGGLNWDYFKFDHVKQARRQVGSTFKPFVYVTAINQMNYTPCHTVSNDRLKIGKWEPRNANGKYGGAQDLRTALAHSTNVVTARLIQDTGIDQVIQTTRDLGVESEITRDYTIALGSADLTVYEMVGAMSAFANGGIYIKPELIVRIEDNTGRVIKNYQPETREVFNEYVAYSMIDLMKGVVDMGTGKWLRTKYDINSEIAGKTGTTNDNSDGWFIGLTPNLTTAVWVGAEDRFAHFRSTAMGQGANTALPIWAYYMKSVYNQGNTFGVRSEDKFDRPEDIDEKWDCSSLTGFHTYGSMGGTIDHAPTESVQEERVVSSKDNIEDVNVSSEVPDSLEIDFNKL